MCGSFDIMYFIIGIFQLCIVLLSELSRIVGFSINPSNVKSTLSTAKEEKKKKRRRQTPFRSPISHACMLCEQKINQEAIHQKRTRKDEFDRKKKRQPSIPHTKVVKPKSLRPSSSITIASKNYQKKRQKQRQNVNVPVKSNRYTL